VPRGVKEDKIDPAVPFYESSGLLTPERVEAWREWCDVPEHFYGLFAILVLAVACMTLGLCTRFATIVAGPAVDLAFGDASGAICSTAADLLRWQRALGILYASTSGIRVSPCAVRAQLASKPRAVCSCCRREAGCVKALRLI